MALETRRVQLKTKKVVIGRPSETLSAGFGDAITGGSYWIVFSAKPLPLSLNSRLR